MNHFLLATMLHLARGHSLRGTGLFSVESLSTDFVLAMLGVGVRRALGLEPLLLPTAVAPLLLIHRSLSVPALQQEARVDPKTGLFNARHFTGELREELERAERSAARPSRDHGRPRPAPRHQQRVRTSRRRRRPRRASPTSSTAICATRTSLRASAGRSSPSSCRRPRRSRRSTSPSASGARSPSSASRWRPPASRSAPPSPSAWPCYPDDGADPNEIIHQADLAVYRAKLQGRNRVLPASSEPVLLSPERKSRLAAVPDESGYGGTELLDVDVPGRRADARPGAAVAEAAAYPRRAPLRDAVAGAPLARGLRQPGRLHGRRLRLRLRRARRT